MHSNQLAAYLVLLCVSSLFAACGDDDHDNALDAGIITDSDTDTDDETGADNALDAGTETDSDTDTDADTDTDNALDAGIITDSDADTDTEADTETGDWDPRFDAFVEALKADLERSLAYGISAAVMEDGVVTFAEAFGSKDADGIEPLTRDTLMHVGSTTKQMTATALLRKVETGEVSLDDTLEELLPELEFELDSTWDDQITVHHLLTHQGGFRDWAPLDGSPDDAQLVDYTYGTFDDTYWLQNPPGAFYNYSNPGFALAGIITQTFDTRLWPDIMYEDILSPLGMDRTFFRKTEVEADGDYSLSFGYDADLLMQGVGGLVATRPVAMEDVPDLAWGRPMGTGTWTTPTQLMAWAKFIMDGDPGVLSDELRGEITTAHVDTIYQAEMRSQVVAPHYGYAMFIMNGYYALDGNWYEMRAWTHPGSALSFINVLYMLPEQKFAVDICMSAGKGLADYWPSLDAAITTLVDLPAPSEAPEFTIDPEQFDDHVGTYHDPYYLGDVIIARDGDTLLVEMPTMTENGHNVGQTLEAISSDIFNVYIDRGRHDITFIRGEPEGLSTYIRNRRFVATRVVEEPDAWANSMHQVCEACY